MWSAITTDFYDFVNTITEDTSKLVTKAIGEEEEEDEEVNIRERMLLDTRRSFLTYSTSIEEVHMKEFDKFLRNFALGSQATEIANVLDLEPEVSRYYAELVPIKISPEEFWARYFFRIMLVNRGGVMDLDDEEEEELEWESNDKNDSIDGGLSSQEVTSRGVVEKESEGKLISRVHKLEHENSTLKSQVKTLVNRIAELEKLLQQQAPGKGGHLSSTPAASSDDTMLSVDLNKSLVDESGKDSNGECSSIKSESGSEKSVVFVGKNGEEEKHEKNSRELTPSKKTKAVSALLSLSQDADEDDDGWS